MHITPEFLKERLIEQYGDALCAQITDGFAAKRVTSARVNTLKATVDEVRCRLFSAGIATRTVEWNETALVVEAQESTVAQTEVYREGQIYLQSLSSMIPVCFLGAQAGENILDMAAAPGGKTTQIAAMTGNGAFITACEKNKIRADRLKYNLEKQGARRTTVLVKDARSLDSLFVFDRVLLDAPCSGSGTLTLWEERPPAITEELIRRSVKNQRSLLSCALAHLRPGRELLYSTCSILACENEEQIRAVLSGGKAELIPIGPEALPGVPLLPTSLSGTLCVCPGEQYEGFFLAKLRRI